MTTLWDDTPSALKSGGALDSLQPVLESVQTPTQQERVEDDGHTWRVWTTTAGGQSPLSLDPATGGFSTSPTVARSSGTPIVFPDPRVDIELGLRLENGDPDGTVRLVVKTRSAFVRVPFLRGAVLDAQGQLRADPAHPDVKFHLPAIDVQWLRPKDGGIDVELKSSTLDGHTPQDQIFDFIRMEPAHALVGPGEVVGFAFRSATLDLTGEAGPSGVPANARTQPAAWQGLYLPEVPALRGTDRARGSRVQRGGARPLDRDREALRRDRPVRSRGRQPGHVSDGATGVPGPGRGVVRRPRQRPDPGSGQPPRQRHPLHHRGGRPRAVPLRGEGRRRRSDDPRPPDDPAAGDRHDGAVGQGHRRRESRADQGLPGHQGAPGGDPCGGSRPVARSSRGRPRAPDAGSWSPARPRPTRRWS